MIAWFQTQPGWVIGFLDEVWWNRFTLPRLHAWQSTQTPLRLQEPISRSNDPDPKATACYGVLWQQAATSQPLSRQMSLRFATGNPVSEFTTLFLEECCTFLQAQGQTEWLLIWDNAPWHCSKQVYDWIGQHNRLVQQERKGVHIVSCLLPSKSPWLNSIEPKWVHAKRAVVEPNRLLTASQLAERVCEYFQCPSQPHLSIPHKVA